MKGKNGFSKDNYRLDVVHEAVSDLVDDILKVYFNTDELEYRRGLLTKLVELFFLGNTGIAQIVTKGMRINLESPVLDKVSFSKTVQNKNRLVECIPSRDKTSNSLSSLVNIIARNLGDRQPILIVNISDHYYLLGIYGSAIKNSSIFKSKYGSVLLSAIEISTGLNKKQIEEIIDLIFKKRSDIDFTKIENSINNARSMKMMTEMFGLSRWAISRIIYKFIKDTSLSDEEFKRKYTFIGNSSVKYFKEDVVKYISEYAVRLEQVVGQYQHVPMDGWISIRSFARLIHARQSSVEKYINEHPELQTLIKYYRKGSNVSCYLSEELRDLLYKELNKSVKTIPEGYTVVGYHNLEDVTGIPQISRRHILKSKFVLEHQNVLYDIGMVKIM